MKFVSQINKVVNLATKSDQSLARGEANMPA